MKFVFRSLDTSHFEQTYLSIVENQTFLGSNLRTTCINMTWTLPDKIAECWHQYTVPPGNHTKRDTGQQLFVFLHLGVYFDSLDAPHRSQSGDLRSSHHPR